MGSGHRDAGKEVCISILKEDGYTFSLNFPFTVAAFQPEDLQAMSRLGPPGLATGWNWVSY